MSTVIWVHGTGVRRRGHDVTLRLIRSKLTELRPEVTVRTCFWGSDLGAELRANGASIPAYTTTRAFDPELGPDDIQVWSLLYADPWIELREYASAADDGFLSAEPPGRSIEVAARGVDTTDRQLRDELRAGGLDRAGGLATAIAVVLADPAWAAARRHSATDLFYLLARAVFAQLVRACANGVPAADGRRRDDIVDLLSDSFDPHHGRRRGLIGSAAVWSAKGTARTAWRVVGAPSIERRRGGLTDQAGGTAGDILLYLARGERIRERILETVEASPPGPVVLLAHSLGGIASVDALVLSGSPRVVKLITVGSQAPYLYELGALPSLAFGAALPPNFPEWVNIYDERDLLSYLGAGVFKGRVRDVPVSGDQPFPWSHSAYWTNSDFYRLIAAELP